MPVEYPPEIGAPGIDERAARHYIGIRIVTHFEGMFAQIDKLFKDLRRWVNARGLAELVYLGRCVLDSYTLCGCQGHECFSSTTRTLHDFAEHKGDYF